MNKFLPGKLVAFSAACFLLFTASAQQLQPNAINQIKSLMQEKELRTPAQKKMDSHLIYGAKIGRGERITSEVVTLEENLNRDAGGLVLVDIHGKINDAILQAITNAGGIIIFSSPRFNVVTARIPLQSAERIADMPEVITINAAFPPRHAGNPVELSDYKTGTTPLKESNGPNLFHYARDSQNVPTVSANRY